MGSLYIRLYRYNLGSVRLRNLTQIYTFQPTCRPTRRRETNSIAPFYSTQSKHVCGPHAEKTMTKSEEPESTGKQGQAEGKDDVQDDKENSKEAKKTSLPGVGMIVGLAVGGAATVVAAPFVLGAVGFTAGGVAAGSWAASMMSAAAVANGGAVAAGSSVAILQSVGAAGLGLGGSALVGSAGAAVGGAVGGVVDKLRGRSKTTSNSAQDESPTANGKKHVSERLKKVLNRAYVMLFLKGKPDHPSCESSRKMVELLKEHNIEFGCIDTVQNSSVVEGLAECYGFVDYPQIFIDGELVGGLEGLKDLIESGKLPLKQPIQETQKDSKPEL